MSELFDKLGELHCNFAAMRASDAAHPLPEVRRRALRSLQFKQQHGLLAVVDVAAALPPLIACLDVCAAAAAAGDCSDALAALQLLGAVIAQPDGQCSAAHAAMQCDADQVLIRLADAAPACTQPATALLGELLCRRGQAGEPYSSAPPSTAASMAAAAPAQAIQRWQSLGTPPPPPPLPWSPELAAAARSPPDAAPASDPPFSGDEGLQRGEGTEKLSEEDQQQLFEVALELGADEQPREEAALLATLATLRHGVLHDMPAAAVAGEPALMLSLLRLLDGWRVAPAAAVAVLRALHALALELRAARPAPNGPAGPGVQGSAADNGHVALAHAALLRSVALCSHESLRHAAVPAALALLPLLAPGGDGQAAGRRGVARLLQALADTLHLALVAECTDADVPPPSDWAAGFHALVLGPASCAILRLLMAVLERVPGEATAQALPPQLCDVVVALASSAVVAAAAPDLHGFARRCLPSVNPAAAAQLQAVEELQRRHDGFLTAVRQLAAAPTAALAAACCREVHSQLGALELLAGRDCEQTVAAIAGAAARHASAPPAAALCAALLLHREASVRQATLEALCQLEGHLVATLLVQPAVAGCLAVALGDAAPRQQLAASLLQAAAAHGAPGQCGQALLPWEAWLLCCSANAAVGPPVAAVLHEVSSQKASLWQHALPYVVALFAANPSAASGAAAQLHNLLVHQRPAAAAAMLFNPLPFDGLLVPAGCSVGPASRLSGSLAAASAAAAKLFTAADVQSLLAVAGNPGLPAELAAAAVAQLAQVAADPRFALILGSSKVLPNLLAHALDGCPVRRVQRPALDCLAAVLECQPAATDWLLADPDARIVPLLPLAFHPLPALRQAVAKLLHHVLFAATARQLDSLMAVAGCRQGRSSTAGVDAGGACLGMPEPFCGVCHFPVPVAARPIWPASPQVAGGAGQDSVFKGSERLQRLWRAQQLCAAAGAGGCSGLPGDSQSLLAQLDKPCQDSQPRWQAELVRASLATLRNLQPAGAAEESLTALAASKDHRQCHMALHRLLLLAVPAAVPEGLSALSAAPWLESMRFLLAAAPLSAEDCCLWLEMLPLLQQVLGAVGQRSSTQSVQLLLAPLVELFVSGSALTWVQEQGSREAAGSLAHVQAALLPAVLHAMRQVLELGMQSGGSAERLQLLAAMRSQDWLALLGQSLGAGSYAGRVAGLQLATAIVTAHVECASGDGGGDLQGVPALVGATMRQVLMPRHLWGTQHHHGKAAVRAALELLHACTQAVPAQQWAAAWADVGTTYWLSRAAADSSAEVRAGAMRLLAAALAAPATHALLQQAWPECGHVVVDATLSTDELPAIRAAAFSAVAAALSHGLSPAAAAADAAWEAAPSAEAAEESGGAEPGMQLAVVPSPPPPLLAGDFLQQARLWDGVQLALQEAEDPALLSAAAHAALQHLLLDADGSPDLLHNEMLLRLLGLPAAAAGPLLCLETQADGTTVDVAEAAIKLRHAVHAARAAAGMLQLSAQLGLPKHTLSPALLPAAAAAFSTVAACCQASLAALSQPAADRLRCTCWAALPPLADAIALLVQAAPVPAAQVREACDCQPQPLAVAVASVLAGPGSQGCSPALSAACCRLLAALLQHDGAAAAFLQTAHGEEHLVPVPPASCVGEGQAGQPAGAVLCAHLIEAFVGAAAATSGETAGQGAEQQVPQHPQQQLLVLHAALGGLLAASSAAKQLALAVGFHTSLLEGCRCLIARSSACGGAALAAACDDAHAATAPEAPVAAAGARAAIASRASKLQQLKQRRGTSIGQPPAPLAFGSRVSASNSNNITSSGTATRQRSRGNVGGKPRAGSRQELHPPLAAYQEEPGASSADASGLPEGDGQEAATESAPSQNLMSTPHTRLLQLVCLLRQLAEGSAASCDALAAAGLVEVSRGLVKWWESGRLAASTAALHSMLGLLSSVLASSATARHACTVAGEPTLLESLVSMVLSARTPLTTAGTAASVLCSFAGAPDGAHALVHTANLPARTLRHMQDCAAAKDWRRLLPALELLAGLCSQAEGQRAVLRCSAPSGDMLAVLLSLAAWDVGAQLPGRYPGGGEGPGGSSAVVAAAEAAMVVVRQLALHPEAKAHLVGGKHGALQSLVHAVGATGSAADLATAPAGVALRPQPRRAAAAAHALWALVHGSGGERAKAALRRCERWAECLQAGLAACKREPGAVWATPLQQGCEALRRLLV